MRNILAHIHNTIFTKQNPISHTAKPLTTTQRTVGYVNSFFDEDAETKDGLVAFDDASDPDLENAFRFGAGPPLEIQFNRDVGGLQLASRTACSQQPDMFVAELRGTTDIATPSAVAEKVK